MTYGMSMKEQLRSRNERCSAFRTSVDFLEVERLVYKAGDSCPT